MRRDLVRRLNDLSYRLSDPLLAAGRKGRLRDHGLAPWAALPVVRLVPEPEGICEHPLCVHLISDARRFHRRNAPRGGPGRMFVPTAMAVDLDRFPAGEAYVRAVSKRSGGRIVRAAKRATRLGVTLEPIRLESYRGSIAAIAGSKRFRSGGPVLAAWLPSRAPPRDTLEAYVPPSCNRHWTLAWAAFVQEGGERRMIAYLSLRRVGDLCRTLEFMGHGDYLSTGATKLLFLEVMSWILDRQAPEVGGLRWFMYGAMEHGRRGLHAWKRRMFFDPVNLEFLPPRRG